MKLGDIYRLLDTISPFSLQEKWDNAGLNIGDFNQDIEHIYLALELDNNIATMLPKHSLLITHHPLIFSPLKTLQTSQYPTNLARILLEKSCALIAMHTNFDTTHLNEYFASEILGFKDTIQVGIARYCKITPTTIANLAKQCKQRVGLEHIRYTPINNEILGVYVVCGSGSSFLHYIMANIENNIIQNDLTNQNINPTSPITKANSCIITGDIKYHNAMIAMSLNIGFIDVEHYHSERYFAKILKSILQFLIIKRELMLLQLI